MASFTGSSCGPLFGCQSCLSQSTVPWSTIMVTMKPQFRCYGWVTAAIPNLPLTKNDGTQDLGCVDIQEVFEANHSNISGRRTSRKRTIHEQLDQGNDESPQDTYSSDDRIINPDVPSGALHNFVPATKLKGMEDWVSEEDQLKYLKKSPDFVVDMKPDDHLVFPSLLKAFTFVRGDVSRFPQPKRTSLGTFSITLYHEPVIMCDVSDLYFRLLPNGRCFSSARFGSQSGAVGLGAGSLCGSRRQNFGHSPDCLSEYYIASLVMLCSFKNRFPFLQAE